MFIEGAINRYSMHRRCAILAHHVGDTGLVLACERDSRRFEILQVSIFSSDVSLWSQCFVDVFCMLALSARLGFLYRSCALYSPVPQATIDKMRCTNIRAHNVDFLSLDPQQAPWNSCDAVTAAHNAMQRTYFDCMHKQVLVDPSCSGSGMRHEHSSVIEESNVQELVALQSKVLRHALTFPNAVRVVYRCDAWSPEKGFRPCVLTHLQPQHLLSLRG